MAGVRQNKHVMARAVLVAMAVAVFVAMGGLPAQAQGLYINFGPGYYPATNCQTFSNGEVTYTTCSNVYYGPTFAPYTVAPSPAYYYYVGP